MKLFFIFAFFLFYQSANAASYGTANESCETTAQHPTAAVLSTTDAWKAALEAGGAGAKFLLNAGTYDANAEINLTAANILIKPNNCAAVIFTDTKFNLSGEEDGLILAGLQIYAGTTHNSAIETAGDNANSITIRNNLIRGGTRSAIRTGPDTPSQRIISGWIIEGNDIDNTNLGVCAGGAIRLTVDGGSNTNTTIRGNKIAEHACEDALQVDHWAGTLLIENNLFPGAAPSNQFDQLIDIKSPFTTGATIIIRGNTFLDRGITSGASVLIGASNTPWAAGTICTIERNHFEDSFRTFRIGEAVQDVGSCTIRNNTFRGLGAGVELLNVLATSENNNIVNNTLYNGSFVISSSSSGNVVRNNIFHTVTYSAAAADIATCSHNVNFSGTGTFPTNCTSTQTGNPLLTNPAAGNLTLSSMASSAVNAGVNIGLAFNGPTFPTIGAYDPPRCTAGEVGLVNATTTIITCTNNVAAPLLPATGCAGFTRQEENPAATWNTLATSVCGRQGTNQIELTHAAGTTGRNQRFSYTPGNVTDSSLVGSSSNQSLLAITNQVVTNNIGAAVSTAVLTQNKFRIYRVPLVGGALDPLLAVNMRGGVIYNGYVVATAQITCTGGAPCPATGARAQGTWDGINWFNFTDGSSTPRVLNQSGGYLLNQSGGKVLQEGSFSADDVAFAGLTELSGPQYPAQGQTIPGCLDPTGLTQTNQGAIQRTASATPTFTLGDKECLTIGAMLKVNRPIVPGVLASVLRVRWVDQTGTPFAGTYVPVELEIVDNQIGVGL